MTDRQIIVCDDEPELRESLIEFLAQRGYRVRGAPNGEALARMIAAGAPDLVILDVRMPKVDGLTALRAIRAQGDLPVIMLTAADDPVDRIVGLELGADDYVGKPVDLRELEARIRSVLRRSAGGGAAAALQGVLEFAGHRLDLDAAQLFDPEGGEIPLTAMEFALLRVLVENRGRVLSRDRLLDLTQSRDWDPFDRSIDLRVSRLRRKFRTETDGHAIIRTVRGIGYVLDPDRRTA